MNRALWLGVWLAAMLWSGAWGASTPAALRQVGFDQRLGEQIPLDLGFRDESGAPVQLGRYFHGVPVLLLPVYYQCPNLCGVTLKGFFQGLRGAGLRPGQEYQVAVVSIDPREGSRLAAAKKASYLQHYGRPGERFADEQAWHFLTGDQASIERLARAIGFRYRYDPELGQYIHASGAVVAAPGGKVSRYLFGADFAPRDLRLATVDASDGRVGTLSDKLWLLCCYYDPVTGRYTGVVTEAMRALGAFTVLAIGGLIGAMVWRGRSARARRPGERGEGHRGH